MLNIDSLIWVVPGMAGLWAYNKHLSISVNQIEGWAYLFTVVLYAVPSYYLFLKPLPNDLLLLFPRLLFAILFAVFSGYALAYIKTKYGRRATLDLFRESCASWRRKLVFMTLKNDKVYLAILLDYTQNPKAEFVIKITPLYSGYRDDRKRIHWTFKYPMPHGEGKIAEEDKIPTELILPKKEIVNFSRWSKHKAFTDAPMVESPENKIT